MMTALATALSAVGGWEAVKYMVNRRSHARREQAQADGEEFKVMRETVEFLQRQLKEKEERFAVQSDRMRSLQDDIFQLLKEKNAIELELVKKRCEVARCANRQPQNGY